MTRISPQVVDGLKARIDSVTSKPDGVPGLVIAVVDRNGDIVFEHASGKRGMGTNEPMTTDTVFWIASCTKMIVAIAAMQLVEQGKLALDDVALVERLAPELRDVKVLQERPDGRLELVEKKQGITLRMLLSHTAGFGYSFFNAALKKWSEPAGIDELSGSMSDILFTPLVNQPGSRWEYGTNIDWAGELVMRASGLKLDDYFKKHIFEPLGIRDLTFFPSDDMKRRLVYMHQRTADGKVTLREEGHPLKRALDPIGKKHVYQSGGAGCFAVPSEYCKIIAALLNNGKSPKTGAEILKPESVKQLFENQIPQFPNFGRQGIYSTKPQYSKPSSDLYPQPLDQAQGWTLAGFQHLHPTTTGRAAGTIWWSGIANLLWWADKERGLGGFVASQILPYGEPDVQNTMAEVEKTLYSALSKTSML
ncbi:hypothetical protein VTN96DRAFT_9119 [Rasamsonia emersonii]